MALPGVTTIIKDQFYALSRSTVAAGRVLCIIGTRSTENPGGVNDAPDFHPVRAGDEQVVITQYGYGSQLHRGFLEAVAAGATQIYLLPLPSSTLDSDLLANAAAPNTNTSLDKAFDAVEQVRADVIVPWGRGGYPSEWETPATPGNDPQFGFYANSSTLVKYVADKCTALSARATPCFAVMGIKPFVDTTRISSTMTSPDVTTQFTATVDGGLYGVDRTTVGSNGKYVSIVATELKHVGYPAAFGFSNGAVAYAATACQLDSFEATTGKTLFSVEELRYAPNRVLQQRATDLGVVPVALDFSSIPIFVDGLTYALSGSDFSRLTTLRITFDAVSVVRQIAQRYVGRPATLEIRNAFETDLISVLRGMQITGALLSSDFIVTYDPANNAAKVDLVLRPAFELRNINLSVSVQF